MDGDSHQTQCYIMTRQVFHATLKFNHATSGKKMRKGIFILLSGAKFYEVNYPISELLRKMKHQQEIYTTSDPSPIRRILCFNSMESLHMCVMRILPWYMDQNAIKKFVVSVNLSYSPSSQVIKILRDHFALKRSGMLSFYSFNSRLYFRKWNSRLEHLKVLGLFVVCCSLKCLNDISI